MKYVQNSLRGIKRAVQSCDIFFKQNVADELFRKKLYSFFLKSNKSYKGNPKRNTRQRAHVCKQWISLDILLFRITAVLRWKQPGYISIKYVNFFIFFLLGRMFVAHISLCRPIIIIVIFNYWPCTILKYCKYSSNTFSWETYYSYFRVSKPAAATPYGAIFFNNILISRNEISRTKKSKNKRRFTFLYIRTRRM